jgi:cobyrinic acid a,c-diamide synthase
MHTPTASASRHCPAVLLAAPASGQGKTTVTAALARHHRRLGRRVRCFKAGPDFLDPQILEQATGAPVYQLDLWMGGLAHCQGLLYQAAGEADLILIEGVMGLYDGAPSSADLAAALGVPVVLLIDAAGMAGTFAAIAHGLATYRPGLICAGVLANRVAGERHWGMLIEGLPEGLPAWGYLARGAEFALPERHLGLLQAGEIAGLDARLDLAADALCLSSAALLAPVAFSPGIVMGVAESPGAAAAAAAAALLAPSPLRGAGWGEGDRVARFEMPDGSTSPSPLSVAGGRDKNSAAVDGQPLAGQRIAIARDPAFSFLYRANLDLLRALGAELVFFSPLADPTLPPAEAVYLPGGYPELHIEALAANAGMRAALHAHHAAGRPMIAECGGMLYLAEGLADADGRSGAMVGLLPGQARLGRRLANLGLHQVTLPEGTVRGHSFHYSTFETTLTPLAVSEPARSGRAGEPIYRVGRLHASYFHHYFPSAPQAVARLFAA